MDVITLGSATVDAFVKTESLKSSRDKLVYPAGSKIGVDHLEFQIGGGGTNTAAVFSALGFTVGYIGCVGDDENGKKILHHLKSQKIRFLGQRKKGMSGYSVVLDSIGHDRTILTHKGVNNSLTWEKRFEKLPSSLLYCNTMLEKSFSTMKKIMKVYHERKGIIALNCSPYFAKQGVKKLGPVLKKTCILIFNKEEASLLLKKSMRTVSQIQNACVSLHKTGPEVVIITDGKEGVYCSDGEFFYHAYPRKRLKVVETTGAGDAFGAGFCAGALEGKDVETCLHMGLHCAESIIQYYGAQNKLLKKKEMQALLKKYRHKIVKKKL